MNIVETLKGLLARVKEFGWGDDTVRQAYETLSPEQKREYTRLKKLDYFVPANAQTDRRHEHLSESGKYKLVVTPYSTKAGSWNYTQGLVFAIGSDEPIAEVQRNYSSFFFEFIEDHPNGHSYLACGEDYQGQTVIELDTGKRRDFLPDAAEQGHGFCWAQYKFDRATQMLIVEGCIWACPYEFRFYDFSDPMEGWPEIECEMMLDTDRRPPEISADGTIKCFQTPYDEDSDDDEKLPEIASTTTLRREGLKLVKIDEWVSEAEKARRAERAENERKHNEKMKAFRATDPLYLAFIELAKDPLLSPESHEWLGITHENWCPTFKGNEQRIGKDILWVKPHRIHVEWAMETGPIKVVASKDGKALEDKFFPHSVQGMQDAFTYAKGLLHG